MDRTKKHPAVLVQGIPREIDDDTHDPNASRAQPKPKSEKESPFVPDRQTGKKQQ
jgi:hypothetical protein